MNVALVLVLAFLRAVSAQDQRRYHISLITLNTYAVKLNASVLWKGALTVHNGSLLYGNVTETYSSPRRTAFPIATVANPTQDEIAPGVIRVRYMKSIPREIFWLARDNLHRGFQCPALLPSDTQPFSCTNLTNEIRYSRVSGGGHAELDISVVVSGPITSDAAAISFGLHRLRTRASTSLQIDYISHSNERRMHVARVVVGYSYLSLSFLCLSLIATTAVMLAWYRPVKHIFRDDPVQWWFSLQLCFVMLSVLVAGALGTSLAMCLIALTLLALTVCFHHDPHSTLSGRGDALTVKVGAGAAAAAATDLEAATPHSPGGGGRGGVGGRPPTAAEQMKAGLARAKKKRLMQETPAQRKARRARLAKRGTHRRATVKSCAGLALLCTCVLLLLLLLWEVRPYAVWDRVAASATLEVAPGMVEKMGLLLYAFPTLASWPLQTELPNRITSAQCGVAFSAPLESAGERVKALQGPFIDRYSIPMGDYTRPNATQYSSVNDWFTRRIRPELRPLAGAGDPSVVVSPADARVVVFPYLTRDAQFWIKSQLFNITDLVGAGGPATEEVTGSSAGVPDAQQWQSTFRGGSMAIVRLAPQDYHRFHMPFGGTVLAQYSVGGGLQAVNPQGMRSGNLAILNQRRVTVVRTERMGVAAVVSIGAVCVGSITVHAKVGDVLVKGQELGYYAFGGSTNVVLFRAGEVTFDADLLYNSERRVETLVRVGTQIASAKQSPM